MREGISSAVVEETWIGYDGAGIRWNGDFSLLLQGLDFPDGISAPPLQVVKRNGCLCLTEFGGEALLQTVAGGNTVFFCLLCTLID